jgi:hypothetical protein
MADIEDEVPGAVDRHLSSPSWDATRRHLQSHTSPPSEQIPKTILGSLLGAPAAPTSAPWPPGRPARAAGSSFSAPSPVLPAPAASAHLLLSCAAQLCRCGVVAGFDPSASPGTSQIWTRAGPRIWRPMMLLSRPFGCALTCKTAVHVRPILIYSGRAACGWLAIGFPTRLFLTCSGVM